MLANRNKAATKAITVRCCMVEPCWKRIGFITIIQAFPSAHHSSLASRVPRAEVKKRPSPTLPPAPSPSRSNLPPEPREEDADRESRHSTQPDLPPAMASIAPRRRGRSSARR
uniref:Uncharacterized protein n=1 Tax=Arundo donax TaxID=35708 RepID=A0A0A9CSP5_ARUDO